MGWPPPARKKRGKNSMAPCMAPCTAPVRHRWGTGRALIEHCKNGSRCHKQLCQHTHNDTLCRSKVTYGHCNDTMALRAGTPTTRFCSSWPGQGYVVTSLMLFRPVGTPTAGMLCAAATCAGAPGAPRRSSGACGHEAKDSNFSNACLTNASASSLHVAGCWLWHGQSCRRFPLRSHCSQGVCLITYLFRSFFPVSAIPCDQSLLYGA